MLAGHAELGTLFASLQVLLNLSRMLIAQLVGAKDSAGAPSTCAAASLLALLPSYKMIPSYAATLTCAQLSLSSLRASDAHVDALLCAAEAGARANNSAEAGAAVNSHCAAEAGAAAPLSSLLLAPSRRLPAYGEHVEAMLEGTPLEAAERADFCRALGAVHLTT